MLKNLNIYKNKKKINIKLKKLASLIDNEFSKFFNINIDLFYEMNIIEPKTSLKLNKQMRKRDYVADVITIVFWENEKEKVLTPLLGEIYLCPKQIQLNANKYKVSFLSEFSRMYIHGIMHLLGFDHEKSSTIEYITINIQDKINKIVLLKYIK